MKFDDRRVGLSTTVGAAIVIGIIVIVGLGVYLATQAGATTSTSTTTSMTNSTSSMTNSTTSKSSSVSSVSGVAVKIPSGAGAGASAAPGYSPDTITVVIGINNTVIWTNDDTVDHTVYSSNIPVGATAFDSPMISPGGNYTQTFTMPGTYQYHCNIHSWMTGTVIVKSG